VEDNIEDGIFYMCFYVFVMIGLLKTVGEEHIKCDKYVVAIRE
jgi:hypothetical protein